MPAREKGRPCKSLRALAVNNRSEVIHLMPHLFNSVYHRSDRYLKKQSQKPTTATFEVPKRPQRIVPSVQATAERFGFSPKKDKSRQPSADPLPKDGTFDFSETKDPEDEERVFDLIPEEPLNRDFFEKRAALIDNYSYNKFTNTIPAQRVLIEEGP